MEIIQLYPYLKNGEVWLDIKEELGDLQIKSTFDDGHWMNTCIEEAGEQVENAVYNQTLYAQEINGKEQENLDSYYAAIRLKNKMRSKITSSSMSQQPTKSQHE